MVMDPSNMKDTFTQRFQLQTPALHQRTSKDGFSSSSQDGTKHKDKAADVSDSNKNIGTSYNSKHKLTELKDMYINSIKNKSKMYIMCICTTIFETLKF